MYFLNLDGRIKG